jgi:4-coumarate--CoA ligase
LFFTVPLIYLLIAKSPFVTYQFKKLVHVDSGVAPMGAESTALAEKKLGCRICQTWGLSETTGSVTALPWDESDETACICPLIPNVGMRIVDDDEKDVEEDKKASSS